MTHSTPTYAFDPRAHKDVNDTNDKRASSANEWVKVERKKTTKNTVQMAEKGDPRETSFDTIFNTKANIRLGAKKENEPRKQWPLQIAPTTANTTQRLFAI